MQPASLVLSFEPPSSEIDALEERAAAAAAARSTINCYLSDYFRCCKPAIFGLFERSISEGFFVWGFARRNFVYVP
jgi:hypothetical protein